MSDTSAHTVEPHASGDCCTNAWDEGYRAGHTDAEKYEHNMDANPYRGGTP